MSSTYVAERRRPAEYRLGPLARGGVVGDHGIGADTGHGQRQRDHHPGPVLARRAVHQYGALGVRDRAQRGHYLTGPVLEIPQVVPGPGIAGEMGPVLVVTGQQHVGDHVGGVAGLGQHRVVHVPHPGDRIQGCRALRGEFRGAAQVDDRGQADLLDQDGDISRRQFLQVVAAQQAAADGLPAAGSRQAAQVTGIGGTFELDPRHDSILTAHAGTPANR